jgi:peptidyl-Asp metalloendopeptidase
MTRSTTFRSWALAALAMLALGACNRDWDGSRAAAVGAGAAGIATTQDAIGMAASVGVPGAQAGTAAGARPAFASLPDRGDLVGYPRQRTERREGAYTWHRADVSEEHALRAIVDGELRITAPNGQLLAFEYERHVEHPTGDWTWIGRLRDAPPGRQAILTFGARAVFGSIAQAVSEPLRLTMRDGASWLVETDPAQLAGVEAQVLRPEAPDFLVPPLYFGNPAAPTASGDSGTTSASGESVQSASSTTSSTATVVDVLVGYTPGFATYHGGDSQARTRINFLVDVANQGYINSQIDARVRLVHAMPVNYPDATDNGDTLEKMTGFKSGTGRTTPDPAFSALRQARETYGADLVTLVRKFNTPENDGCGIAWLLGSGLSNIQQGHEYFGYSVVSDGVDQGDDGKNYFCRDETMVHEFGHNMGSAHDIETAKGDDGVLQTNEYGRYTYSFGYRAGTDAGDFYTIMAYREKRDSGPQQQPYRVFSNPDITFCGSHACGTSSADNARSLRQTIPVIAGFRSTVVAAPAPVPMRGAPMDVNVDGKSDIFLRGGTNAFAYWGMNGAARVSDAYLGTATDGFRFVAFGNFDGTGGVDVLWADGGRIRIWFNDSTARYVVYPIGSYGSGWTPFATSDVNGDGKSDILFRGTDGTIAHWRMDSTIVVGSAELGHPGDGYRLVGSGDFNSDGYEDLAWTNGSDIKLWLNNGASGYTAKTLGSYSGGWVPVAVGDVNGDGASDILFEGGTALAYWAVSQGNFVSSHYVGDGGTGFRVFAVADYNGDGLADIGWQNGSSIKIWMNGGSGNYSPTVIGSYICCWQPEGGLPSRQP